MLRLFDTYIERNIVENVGDDRFRVTADAWDRLCLRESADTGQAAPNENEAPTGEADGASETGGEDADTSEPLEIHSYQRLRA